MYCGLTFDKPVGTQAPSQRFAHPWLALVVFLFTIIQAPVRVDIFFFGFLGLSPDPDFARFAPPFTIHLLTLFALVPFVLRLPNGHRSFRHCLDRIRLTGVQPRMRIILLAFSACAAFGAIHLLNLGSGRETAWVLAQAG